MSVEKMPACTGQNVQSNPATLTIAVLIFLVILPMLGYFRSDTPMALLMACSALLLFGLVQYRIPAPHRAASEIPQ